MIITALHLCGSDSSYWTKKSTLELAASSFVRSGTVQIDRALCAVIFFKCFPFSLSVPRLFQGLLSYAPDIFLKIKCLLSNSSKNRSD